MIACLWLVLGACAPRGAPEQSAWEARRAAASALTAWRMEGRLGALHGGRRWKIKFDWSLHASDNYRIDIRGPFGRPVGVVRGTARGVSFRNAAGRARIAPTPEALFAELLGFEMPVSALRYWALGLPAPGAPPREIETQGEVLSFRQAGWRVSYHNWQPALGTRLPGELRLERDGAEARLRIDRWSLPAGAGYAV